MERKWSALFLETLELGGFVPVIFFFFEIRFVWLWKQLQGTTMFNCAKAECPRFQVLPWRGHQGRVGEGGTSCSSYISFLSFLIKGDEQQP